MSFPTAIPSRSTETFRDKAVRKFKEEPLVPIGTIATTAAMIIAMTKFRSGNQKSLNNWLRARIIAQGLTIAAVVAGSYAYGRTQQQVEAKARMDQERLLENAAKGRAEFEERLKGAEEAHLAEQSQPLMSKLTGRGSGVPPGGDANKVSKIARFEQMKEGEGKTGGFWSWFGWR